MNISVTHGPGGTLAFAGAELHDYLVRMLPADANLSIALVTRPAPGNDAFSVDLSPAGGTIAGSSERAVLLGVYDALHALGCRFLAPGKDNEVVPQLDALPQLRYERTAAYRHRGVCIEGADSRENILTFIDWLPKAGFNAFFLQFKTPYVFLDRWYRHLGNPSLPPEPFGAEAVMAEAEAEIRRRGLMLHKVGHGWTGQVLGYDALTWDADARPLAEDKRPLAALVDGVRGLYQGVPTNTNLCLSNSEAVARFADAVADYAAAHRDVDYLHVWLADEYNNVCQCPACQKELPTDQYVALLNAIDERLTDRGLDTKIVFLLYQELLWPPVKARLTNPGRFTLMFAPISRTFERSYDLDTPRRAIPPYRRNRITLPADLGENMAFLRGWQEVFNGDSFVYDYPLGRSHYGDLGYVHIARVIHGDIRRLAAMGLNGYISCQELRAGMPNYLPNYVMGRALLDADADIEELIGEYFDAAYGDSAREALGFLSSLSDLSRCDYVNGKGPRTDPDMAVRMAETAALCERFAQGHEAAPDTFPGRLGFHARYTGLLAWALESLARGDEEEAAARRREMLAFLRENESAYQPWLDVYRLGDVTARYTGFSE